MKISRSAVALIRILATTVVFLAVWAAWTWVEDPLFHYRRPQTGLYYRLREQRYQNDGLIRHLDYDCLLLGSSMTENFDSDELGRELGEKVYRASMEGARFADLGRQLRQALTSQEPQHVIICLDRYNFLLAPEETAAKDLPTYLYDEQWQNDWRYLWNSSLFWRYVAWNHLHRCWGSQPLSLATYGRWDSYYTPGRETVLKDYHRPALVAEKRTLTEAERAQVRSGLEHNFGATLATHPNLRCDFFLPPYSLVWWDGLIQEGRLDFQLELEQEAIRYLLSFPSVRVFSFDDYFEITEDLDNYKDPIHYMGAVNRRMGQDLAAGRQQLNADTLGPFYQALKAHYLNYDWTHFWAETD